MSRPPVALVCMPFHACRSPSMALGLLKAILERAGIAATIYNFNLDFLKCAVADPLRATDRELDFEHLPPPATGEWVFRPAGTVEEESRSARELARTLDRREDLGLLCEMRRAVDPFLDACVELLLSGGHEIVGFGVSYLQTRAALRLAESLRRRAPETRIVLGGASVCGVKGRALIQAFPAIDVVCHGEADLLIEPLVRALRGEPGHTPLDRLRGISFRSSSGLSLGEDDGPRVELDELPPPDHREWTRKVAAMREAGELNPLARLSLSFETARGCWWGAKHHCSFCSFPRPAFRAKAPARVLEELEVLAERHGLRAFFCVDSNLAPGYLDTLLPALEGRGLDLFWNVKPNLTREQIARLSRAGVRAVLVGIESLITPTLALLNKGSTGIRNIQALKWFAEHDVLPHWNYLSYVPGEHALWLEELARLLPRLMHLAPPYSGRVIVERYSPYHAHPARHGIAIIGPDPQMSLAFPELAPELLGQLSHCFDHEIVGRDPAIDASFAATIWPLLVEWCARHARDGCTLAIVHGPAESLVVHGPFWRPRRLQRVRGEPRRVLCASEGVCSERSLSADRASVATATVPSALYESILGALAQSHEPEIFTGEGSLAETLAALDQAALIVREGKRVLALPVDRSATVQSSAAERRLALLRLRGLLAGSGSVGVGGEPAESERARARGAEGQR